jgi:hypothetical protein
MNVLTRGQADARPRCTPITAQSPSPSAGRLARCAQGPGPRLCILVVTGEAGAAALLADVPNGHGRRERVLPVTGRESESKPPPGCTSPCGRAARRRPPSQPTGPGPAGGAGLAATLAPDPLLTGAAVPTLLGSI